MPDIAIAGGGHTGLLAAIALKQAGFEVVVIERSFEPFRDGGRSLAMLAGSQHWIARIGAWNALRAYAEPVKYVDVFDPATGSGVRYSHQDVGVEELAWGFRQSELRERLLRHYVGALGGQVLEADVRAVRRTGGRIILSTDGGTEVDANLLVGADGRGSRIRRMAGITVARTDFRQQALSFVVRHARPHRQTVVERFLSDGPLAVLPLRHRHSGITWVRRASTAIEDPTAMLEKLDGLVGDRLGALQLATRIEVNPLGALHAHAYVAARTVLVGDAAHGAHPIHAQGYNMAVADVIALVDEIAAAGAAGDDIGGACLRRYEALRRQDNRQRLAMTSGLNRLFGYGSAMTKPARALLLRSLRDIPPLRRRAIRHGMRLSG